MADKSSLALLTDNSATFSTLDSSQSQSNSSRGIDATRDELERRQLMHTVQLLKLEVSQKQLILESVKNEQSSQLEELREKLADVSHEKKLLTLRLQSMTAAYEQELKIAKETSRQNLGQLLTPMRDEVKVAFQDFYLTDEEYSTLSTVNTSALSLADYIKLRIHELTKPIMKENECLQSSMNELSQQLSVLKDELLQCQVELKCSKEQVISLEGECLKQKEELTSFKALVQERNYKINNFDDLQRECDELKAEVKRLKQSLKTNELRESVRTDERNKAAMELSSLKQTVELLIQDKQYLEKQLSEAKLKCQTLEQRNEDLCQKLDKTKVEKENVLHKLVHSKEKSQLEYEHKLHSEIETVMALRTLEIEQLKTQSKEIFERENRSLREARDSALDERNIALASEREMSKKIEVLMKEHHLLQSSYETRVCKLEGELQLTHLERDRNNLFNQEMAKDLKHCQLELEKLQKKNDILTKELWSTEATKGAALKEIETQLQDTKQKLETYEKLEKELDGIVLQCAADDKQCDVDKVMFSYGFGASVPTTSRRRLQQSAELAQRVLHLERNNRVLKNQVENETKMNTQLQQKLHRCEELLSKVQQPHSYLMEEIKLKDIKLADEQDKCIQLQREINVLQEERKIMIETRNQMANDLEKLLNHKEELHLVKQVLLGVLNKHPPSAQEADKPHPPSPTLFTKLESSKK